MMLYIRGRYKETLLSCDREVLDYAHSKNIVWEEAICFACATTRFWPKRWNSGGGGYSYKRKDQEAGALARERGNRCLQAKGKKKNKRRAEEAGLDNYADNRGDEYICKVLHFL